MRFILDNVVWNFFQINLVSYRVCAMGCKDNKVTSMFIMLIYLRLWSL